MLVAQVWQKCSQGCIIQHYYLPCWVYLVATQAYEWGSCEGSFREGTNSPSPVIPKATVGLKSYVYTAGQILSVVSLYSFPVTPVWDLMLSKTAFPWLHAEFIQNMAKVQSIYKYENTLRGHLPLSVTTENPFHGAPLYFLQHLQSAE